MFRQSQRKAATKPALPETVSPPTSNSLHPLTGRIISYTGLAIHEREDVNKKVRAMGGEVHVDLTEDVTHLIATKTGSQKYKVAFAKMIPVVSIGWINSLHSQWTNGVLVNIRKATEEYAMGPLKGCNICVTGLPTDLRIEIDRATVQHGGKYTSDMVKGTTTHLICDQPTGAKYRSALLWGIKCVPYDWLLDTLESLELADETLYTIPEEGYRRSISAGTRTIEKGLDNESLMELRSSRVPDTMYLESCYIFLCPTFQADLVTRIKKMIRMAGGIHVTEYDPAEVTHVVVPSDQLNPSTMAIFEQGTDLPYIVNYQWLRLSNREGKVLPEADYIVPFPSRADSGMQKLANLQGKSTWTTDAAVAPPSNHTRAKPSNIAVVRSRSRVFAADSATPDTNNLPKHIHAMDFSEYRNDGGVDSVASTPADRSMASPNDSIMRGFGQRNRTVSGILTDALGDLSMAAVSQAPSQFDSSLTMKTDQLQLQPMEEEEAPSNIFLGLCITTYECKDAFVETIKKETVARGGVFFAQGEPAPVSVDDVYTVVPLNRTYDSVKHLKGTVVTSCWFESSVLEERWIPKDRHFLFKPLRAAPIPGFETLCISVSSTGITEVEYKHMQRAIKILGGAFHDKLHKLETNLLLASTPDGPKYAFMAKNNRKIAKIEWLKDCAEQGMMLPIEDYPLVDHSESPENLKTEECHGQSGENTPTATQRPLEPPVRVKCDKPFQGLNICILGKVEGDRAEMMDVIAELGGRFITTFDSTATHFVHKGRPTKEVVKYIRQAEKDGILCVSPLWIYKCQEAKTRLDEMYYPVAFDRNQLTLDVMASQVPASQSLSTRPSLPRMSQRHSSPAMSTTVSIANSGPRSRTQTKRAATVGSLSLMETSSPSQSFHGTAAGVTSALYGNESSSAGLSSVVASANQSMEVTQSSMELGGGGPMSLPQESGYSSGAAGGIWQPIPGLPPVRSSTRKRRRLGQSETSSNGTMAETTETPDGTVESSTIPEDYFDVSDKYGEGAIYWDDVDSRERKRALLESMGEKVPPSALPSSGSLDPSGKGTKSLPPLPPGRGGYSTGSGKTGNGQVPGDGSVPHFLMTGVQLGDRPHFWKVIKDLGGVVLEEVTDLEDDWKRLCTHLITAGHNPPKTAKLRAARMGGAMIVHKNYLVESEERGRFVDEEKHRVYPV